ncbi:MAG: septum formation initiator family protein [Lachnospiraceae bacterium]|nr:septum formation initiator family protein [Lachnospiraceae bacterium]MBP3609567.1 septum formation initiator family protein [Lachnospiraceae bacterium]
MEQRKYQYMADYENGSAVRKLQPQWEPEQEEVRRPRRLEQPQEEPVIKTGLGIDLISALLLMSAIAVTLLVCVNYLKVQSDVVQLNKSISGLEQQLSSLEKENNALESVLENEQYDLETVYQMAVGVLGMVYPNNNEVLYYNNEAEGYYRQYQDIPE